MCRQRHISVEGTKKQLIERINKFNLESDDDIKRDRCNVKSNDNTEKEASNLYNNCIQGISHTKLKFEKIIKFINDNQVINDQLPSDLKTHLNHLKNLWKNNDDANIDYYFKMKDHHSRINGRIDDKILKKMWMDYICIGLEVRIQLMKLNFKLSTKLKNR